MKMDNIRYDIFCKVLRIIVVVENVEEIENVEIGYMFFLIEKLFIYNFYLELYMLKLEEKYFCLNMILESLEMF